MAEQLSGAALDARFFEVCWGWREYPMGERMLWRHNVPCDIGRMTRWEHELPEVSTDANACEQWAMRWAREQGLRWEVKEMANDFMAIITMPSDLHGWFHGGRGTDYKEAFVRACVTAGLALTKGEAKHEH